MIYRKTFFADNFPTGFESSKIQIPNGQRSAFEKLTSSKFARVLKCNILLKTKVYSLIIKQYFNRNLLDIFKSIICSRAQKAFRAGQMLTQNGFLVPPAVACGRKFLMTMEIKDSTPLYQLLAKLSPAQKQKMIEQFGQTIGLMHNKGIFHGDLRLGNILVKSAEDKFNFYFLDNERTKKFSSIPHSLRLKNLVQINMHRDDVTDDDRKIFFQAYLSQQQIPIDKDKLSQQIKSKTAKRLAAKTTIYKSN